LALKLKGRAGFGHPFGLAQGRLRKQRRSRVSGDRFRVSRS
jgi:hypothetical protein